MRPIYPLALLALITACGGSGGDPCEAVAQLTELDQRFTDGDVGTAMADRDRDGLVAAFSSVADEAVAIRDQWKSVDGEAAELIAASAGGFVRGANLLEATFAAETIREGDLDAGLGYIDDGRADLRRAEATIEGGCE